MFEVVVHLQVHWLVFNARHASAPVTTVLFSLGLVFSSTWCFYAAEAQVKKQNGDWLFSLNVGMPNNFLNVRCIHPKWNEVISSVISTLVDVHFCFSYCASPGSVFIVVFFVAITVLACNYAPVFDSPLLVILVHFLSKQLAFALLH